MNVKIQESWEDAGKEGVMLGEDVFVCYGMEWAPVLWEGEEDPVFHKVAGLRFFFYTEKIKNYISAAPFGRVTLL